ncbi:hypothetical protein [Rodentibacter pneumotropicus]|uniref:hypothetical protein n=1 Tax=Rodentibacter pneumotropicus TaxID=758 RepID=UPI00098697F4|nr:hypothetical protein [Rodentibacter pneumotropicus]OOF64759.1 hypothetical protein BKL50_00690 [Rodentibacter pneumotropicus]THA16563.1 hypothetical protein D3M83_09285 [Rodentibacter pneumotropicus]
MRKTTAFLAMIMALPALANTYTVRFSDGRFGRYSNYLDGRITEVCIHQVGYLMTDNGHLIVAVNKYNQPIICGDKNEKTQPTAQNP